MLRAVTMKFLTRLHHPKKDVVFNQSLTHDDGLLVGTIAKIHQLKYDEAKEMVSQQVQKLWLLLEKEETVYIKGIGSFSAEEDLSLVFSPNLEVNFLAESYGLSSFKFPPLSYQKETVPLFSRHKQTSNINSPTMNKVIKVAAIAIPLLAIVALVPFNSGFLKKQTAGFGFSIDSGVQEQQAEIKTIEIKKDSVIPDTDKRSALFYTEDQPKVEKPQDTQGLTFYIIAGSYKSEENALSQSKILQDKGYNAEVVFEKELFRVSLMESSDKVTALHELRRLRGIENNASYWLMAVNK